MNTDLQAYSVGDVCGALCGWYYDGKRFPFLHPDAAIRTVDIDAMLGMSPFKRGRELLLPSLASFAARTGWMPVLDADVLPGGEEHCRPSTSPWLV